MLKYIIYENDICNFVIYLQSEINNTALNEMKTQSLVIQTLTTHILWSAEKNERSLKNYQGTRILRSTCEFWSKAKVTFRSLSTGGKGTLLRIIDRIELRRLVIVEDDKVDRHAKIRLLDIYIFLVNTVIA